jgi:rhodanese-related sulfurtransferase
MASNRISPEEATLRAQAGEPVVFVDARNPKDWSESDQKIPKAIRVPADEVESHLAEIPRGCVIVAYCT